MTRRHIATALALAGAAALAAVPAHAGVVQLTRKPQKRTVKVLDNYFQPTKGFDGSGQPAKLTVDPGSTVTWRWDANAAEIHDVKLVRAPKGVRRWQSDPGGYGYVFRRRFKVSGTYRLVCTFHVADGMKMTIVVRKAR
ncbi:MAG TPA: plastocyanin/azurin family copper-binding protein [Solirubrobacteraceae bacterium]|nr:plastocyanin/azurin family copper-binding protein [Solirubrobacteraceae bacterium]